MKTLLRLILLGLVAGIVTLLGFSLYTILFPSEPSEQLLSEAASLEAEGDSEAAQRLRKRALNREPENAAALRSFLRHDDSLSAEEIESKLERVIEGARPISANDLAYFVEVSAREGLQEKSEFFFQRLLEDHPGHSEGFRIIGEVLRGEGENQEAARAYEIALQQNPNDVVARFALGVILGEMEGMAARTRAKVLLKQVARSDADPDLVLRSLMGLVMLPNLPVSVDERRDALRRLSQHSDFSPDSPVLQTEGRLFNLRLLRDQFRAVNLEQATTFAHAAVEASEGSDQDLIELTFLQQQQGAWEEAAASLESTEDKTLPGVIGLQTVQAFRDEPLEEALTGLETLVATDYPEGIKTLVLSLVWSSFYEELDSADRIKLATKILNFPRGQVSDNARLNALNGLISEEVMLDAEAVAEVAALFQQPFLFGNLLMQSEMPELVLAVANTDLIEEKDRSYELRLRALTFAERHEEALALKEGASLDDPLLFAALHASTMIRAGQREEGLELWDQAFNRARVESRVDVLRRLALALGSPLTSDPERSVLAFRTARSFGTRFTSGEWLTYVSNALEVQGIEFAADLAAESLVHYPQNLVFLNNKVYLETLLGLPVDERVSELEDSLEIENVAAFRTTVSFARLNQGFPGEALDLIEGMDGPWEEMIPVSRAIYALILAENRRDTQAHEVARTVDAADLSDRELSLMAEEFPDLFTAPE